MAQQPQRLGNDGQQDTGGPPAPTAFSSPRVPLLLTRRNIHIPPTISQNHDSVPITTPLCHGERNSKMALDGHQTNVGTKNPLPVVPRAQRIGRHRRRRRHWFINRRRPGEFAVVRRFGFRQRSFRQRSFRQRSFRRRSFPATQFPAAQFPVNQLPATRFPEPLADPAKAAFPLRWLIRGRRPRRERFRPARCQEAGVASPVDSSRQALLIRGDASCAPAAYGTPAHPGVRPSMIDPAAYSRHIRAKPG